MRIKKALLMLFMLFFVINFATAIDYSDKKMLTSIVILQNKFDIITTTPNYFIERINASVSFFPKEDDRQNVKYITTEPKTASFIGDDQTLNFLYFRPTQTNFIITIKSEVKTQHRLFEISKKVLFPINNINKSYYLYLQPTNNIDITSDIRNIASELRSGKNDLFEIEYAFAEYVRKNIKYDLNSLTEGVNQKSSWVLKNKEGVCDEITNLFISLNRASGIPARFISGVAYTNLNSFETSWVSHAWAEVYFPEYGWIPYDVTYGEYGFIDAAHIKLMDSYDSVTPSLKFEYAGKDISLKTHPIDIDVNILNYSSNKYADYSFTASVYRKNIGLNSYNLVAVDLENEKNFYQVADLYLGKTEKIKILDEGIETISNEPIHRKEVLLKPFEKKKVYWMIKLEGTFNDKYAYTFPIIVYNSYNETSTTMLTSEKNSRMLYYEDAYNIMMSQEEEIKKPYSKNVLLECLGDKDKLYLEDTLKISCILDNQGDIELNELNICIDGVCQEKKIGIEKINVLFDKKFTSEGIKNVEIKAYNNEILKTNYLTIDVLDKPNIKITNITYPPSAKFNDVFNIEFKLSKESASDPKKIVVIVKSPVMKKQWFFDVLSADKSFKIISDGAAMKMNDNQYIINVTYQDDKNNNYSIQDSFNITSNANFGQKIILALNVAGYWIESQFS